jgi:hypothetical protein
MVNRRFVHENRVHQFVVTQDINGWNVREEEDQAILRHVHHADWHRVERDLQLFELRHRAQAERMD